jgi:hypothetical protein
MVYGVFNPQYQRYGEKILIGSDLNSLDTMVIQFQIDYLGHRTEKKETQVSDTV